MGDDYQSNYQKGYQGQAGAGPGYHMGQADRAIKQNREHWAEQQRQQDAWRKRDEDHRRQYEDGGAAGGVVEAGPGFYEQFPRLEKLSNWLAFIFFVLGAAAGVAAAMQSQHSPGIAVIVITGIIVGLIFGAIGKALPWAFFMALSLAVGLGILAIGVGLIVGVVYGLYYLVKAVQ